MIIKYLYSKEMVRMEHKSRRNYPRVWSKVAEKETNKFYHQDEIDKQLKDKLSLQGKLSVSVF